MTPEDLGPWSLSNGISRYKDCILGEVRSAGGGGGGGGDVDWVVVVVVVVLIVGSLPV